MKHYYLVVDTETTCKGTVADFGAVIMDRKGAIIEQLGVLVDGHFGKLPLFSDRNASPDSLWSFQSAQRRVKEYDKMLDNGQRIFASYQYINLWLARVNGQYAPAITAYNMAFDSGKCRNTRINIGVFSERFCLMKAAKATIGMRPDYQAFCFANDFLTAKLRQPQMTADAIARYLVGESLEPEPHSALEDARDYEAVILTEILKTHSRKKILELGK
tara:strand:- start:241 stop:891 length:651 start_codon:yes stop_codon:yes gene_type:complete